MKNLLSTHNRRHLELLEFLVKNNSQWILLKKISEHLNTPIRTVHSDIKEINTYITPLSIHTSPSGVKLSIPPNYSERYIYKKILELSHEFNILEFIFMNEGESIQSLAEKFHISESTTKRIIKKINLILCEEDFSIHTKPLSLLGDEKKINQFMSFYFSERYLFQEEFMTTNQIDLINILIEKTIHSTEKEMYFPNFKRLSIRIYLCCIRFKNQHKILIDPHRKIRHDILANTDFCQRFFEEFGITLDSYILNQLFYIFSTSNYAFSVNELLLISQTDANLNALYIQTKKVLKKLSILLNIPLSKKTEDKLLISIINVISIKDISSHHIFIIYNQKKIFLEELSTNYIYVRDLVNNYLKENITLNFSEDEWNELTYILLTHWPDLYYKIRFIEVPIKVFLLIDTDIEHGQLIKNELETYCRYLIEVDILKDYSLTELQKLPHDSILVTNIPNIVKIQCSVLCFGGFLNNSDWKVFIQLLENILLTRKNTSAYYKS